MTDNSDLLRKVQCMIPCIFSIPEMCISKFLNAYAAAEHCEIAQFNSINFLVWYYKKILMNTLKLEEFDI